LCSLLAVAGTERVRPSQAQAVPTLSQAALPATGRQETFLSVSTFGRYAVTVNSPQGTALQLIDRLAGPGKVQGEAGASDGRVDAFLDRGEYKIVAYSDPKGAGEAKLAVHAFTTARDYLHPPLLVELKPVEGSLNDFEQVSYWLDVKERRQVILEAAGRNLADLHLWTNGDWLVDAAPATAVVEPQKGRPLLVCRLTADLNPGIYLLTAYGGAGQPWAEQSNEHPFYLRFGIPRLGRVGRSRHVVSPFGTDRWLVPGETTYFRVELPEPQPASLEVGKFDPQQPFQTNGSSATIHKNSLLPVAELEVEGSTWHFDHHVVTVTAAAGQPYVLQQFDIGRRYFCGGRYWPLGEPGTYWVSTVHSGDPTDSVDATALVHRWQDQGPHLEPFAAQVVDLDTDTRWVRRCNLLDTLTLFFHVRKAGKYQVLARGTAARFRIQPFLVSEPEHYEPPPSQESGYAWDLEPGYYVLTAEPMKEGILDLAIVPGSQSSAPDVFRQLLGKGREAEMQSIRPAVQFPQLDIDRDYTYTLFINQQPEVKVGMVLRRYPLDLTDPLPVIQQPGETVRVPFAVDEDSTLHAEAEDDSLLDVSVDKGPAKQTQTISKGQHTLEVRYKGATRVNYALSTEPVRLQARTALPPLPNPERAAPLKFTELTDKAPQFLDLDRSQSATFLVRADQPALYRLQSTGLLATSGSLRTRTVTSLDEAALNGVGRNFFIEQFLREGDYQVTVTALGQSKGHLGLTLERTPLTDGGILSAGVAAHMSVPAGDAVVYTFKISEAGDYRLRSIGAGTTFRGRLEDAEGWPIETPNRPADIRRHFDPGAYRLVTLPEPVTTRRLTLLERVPPPLKFQGHGPHELPLAKRVQHTWMEPAAEAQRTPDMWQFTVPAPIDVAIDLTGEMQGTLSQVDADGQLTAVAPVPPSRGWKGTLKSGRYRLDVQCVRTNNRAPYEVTVWPRQMVAGLDRAIEPPADIPISVGQESLIQLSSFGPRDVRALLYDAAGHLVASNDDGPDDWNFQIQSRLPSGTYTLHVDPVGTASVTPTPAGYAQPQRHHLKKRKRWTQSGGQSGAEGGSVPTPKSEELPPEGTEATAAATVSAESSIVSMRNLEEVEQPALSLPAKVAVDLNDVVHLYPLQFAKTTSGVLAVAASSAEGVGVAVEARSSASIWRTAATASGRLARFELPFDSTTETYRLRMWSPGGRPTTVRLRAAAAMPRPATEQRLQAGVGLSAVAGIDPAIGVGAVRLDRPGVLRLSRKARAVRVCSVVDTPCAAAPNDLVAAETTLWLVTDLRKSGDKKTIAASRLILPPGAQQTVQLEVSGGRPLTCDLLEPKGGPVLAIATSMGGQPGIRLTDRQDAGNITDSDAGMAVGLWSAAAAALSLQHPAAVVWKATGDAPIAVRLQQLSYAPPAAEPKAWGTWDASITGITDRAFDLPEGAKRLHLALGGSTVAVLSAGDQVASLHWLGNMPFEETAETSATRLTILHTRDTEDRFRVEVLPLGSAAISTAVSPGAPYENAMLGAGMIRLGVTAGESDPERPFTLHVRGANAQPTFVGADGRISRGVDVPAGSSGTLLIRHDSGLLLAWIDRPGEEALGLWGRVPLPQEGTLEPPAVVQLKGTVESLRFEPKQPVMLHLRTSTPLITLLKRGEAVPEVEVHAAVTVLDAYLSAEPTLLGLRAPAGGTLTGTAEVTASPVTPISEGLGPETLLAAGDTSLFSFTVTREGPVGIGVRANPDVVDCTLLDSAGRALGSGTVQMPTLKPGTYLLALHAPTATGPVQARPALAGVVLPGTGPPEDVIRRYMAPPSPLVTPMASEEGDE
jgi:hypothetical protein